MMQETLAAFPRIRFMGSKHRLAPRLAELFATLPPGPAIDAFSGSGVVAYTLKATGRATHANDHLTFTATLAEALVANQDERLSAEDVERSARPTGTGGTSSPARSRALLPGRRPCVPGRGLVARRRARGAKRALALSALCLAAAWNSRAASSP